ncbi:MAG: response regulator [Verrucomicrobia bacterium]|nr:response regulator [Verrucomicrobiota bacterium]
MRDELLTASQVGEMLGVSVGTVHRWTSSGILKASRTIGGHRRYSREAVERTMKEYDLGPPGSHEQKKVVVVADNDDVRRMCVTALGDAAFIVIEAKSGEEALGLIAKDPPDLVLLDLEIGGETDSVAVLDSIQHHKPPIDVLLCTEYSEAQMMTRALAYSPFQVIRKPFSAPVLQRAVRAFIRKADTVHGEMDVKEGAYRILVVDDDVKVRTGLKASLSTHAEYDVRTAADGYQAGRIISEFKPHVIILDLLMDGLDGFDVCKDVKSSPEFKNTRVLVLTGYPGGGNVERIKRCGADAVLTKPVSIDYLEKEIQRLAGDSSVTGTSGD